jgi:hypothetical protein
MALAILKTPQLIQLWGLNTQTEVESKKNFAQLTAE